MVTTDNEELLDGADIGGLDVRYGPSRVSR